MTTRPLVHSSDDLISWLRASFTPRLSSLRTCFAIAILGFALDSRLAVAAVSVSPDIAYFYSEGPGEGLSVSSDGLLLMVSSPIPGPGGVFTSSVPQAIHTPWTPEVFHPIHEISLLGLGEVTDVAVVPHRFFGLAVVRGDTVNPSSALLVLRGNRIQQTIPIPQNPDGMKVSPDGRYAIVAVEKGGDIRIYDLLLGPGRVRLVAQVSKAAIAAHFVGVPNPVAEAEPEAVGISADSSFALVTLQDCSSVVALDLNAVRCDQNRGWTPEQIGDAALKGVVHLPYGFIGSNGALFGVEPDGVGISPDGSFAIVAHEANQRAKHLAGFSVLDLRGGLQSITARTYSAFDVDPTLLANTGLTAAPIVAPGAPYPSNANKLPRLDVAASEIVNRCNQMVAAVAIERYDPSAAQLAASTVNETRGSVLFMNAEQALDGIFPIIDRVPVGVTGSRIEVIDSADHGHWIFVSISNGGGTNGTVARLELQAD